ncbi:MAG: carbonic anhydrase [Planctomycetota bacterium]|nr:MAG: carbonic anhydrase [Planctomycetota bacterium]
MGQACDAPSGSTLSHVNLANDHGWSRRGTRIARPWERPVLAARPVRHGMETFHMIAPRLLTSILALLILIGCAAPERPIATARDAIEELKTGNERFAAGRARHPHSDRARRIDTAEHGQHPFAAVVGCSDSRVPVEIVLDQGLGDLFVIRVAGNVIATDETGSIEYVVEHLGIPLVVVMGHVHCGAVTAVLEGSHEHGSISELVGHIQPAVEKVRREHPGLSNEALVPFAVEQNVWHSIEDLIAHSDGVRGRITAGTLEVIGAVYDISTAKVRWLGRHPDEAALCRSSMHASN